MTAATQNPIRYENMGLIRYILALAVMIAHFCEFFGVENWFPVSSAHAVGGFFGLSGFLVFASYRKTPDLKTYIGKRVRRIVPAYFFIVILCAVSLVSLSTLSAAEYFSSWQLYKYLAANLSCLNFLQPTLPGVFTDNFIPAVNGSLWTIKIEWCLYLSVPVVAWLISRFRWKLEWTIAGIYLLSLAYKTLFLILYQNSGAEIYNILSRQFFGQLMYFYWGVLLYYNLHWVLKNKRSIILCCAIGLVANSYFYNLSIFTEPIIVTTLTIILSVGTSWVKALNGANNLSYDMYLYHFPIAQSLWVLLHGKMEIYIIFAIYTLLTIALAAVSWHGIGRRFLRADFYLQRRRSK